MNKFGGFTSSETFTRIPDSFFRDLLNRIDDPEELRATLHALWRFDHMEPPLRFLRRADFGEYAPGADKAVARGTLLRFENESGEYFLLNSPLGRAALDALQSGKFDPASMPSMPPVERSNIFTLYEQNIGALTPLVADMLTEAEKEYPPAWLQEAFEIAVARNVRNWKYVEAILKRWKEKGRDEGKDQQDAVKDFKRYTEGEFSEFFRD